MGLFHQGSRGVYRTWGIESDQAAGNGRIETSPSFHTLLGSGKRRKVDHAKIDAVDSSIVRETRHGYPLLGLRPTHTMGNGPKTWLKIPMSEEDEGTDKTVPVSEQRSRKKIVTGLSVLPARRESRRLSRHHLLGMRATRDAPRHNKGHYLGTLGFQGTHLLFGEYE
jgi:hypothetical protein